MKVYDAAAIRNLAVVGHGGCGQDSAGFGSALLCRTAANRLGRVDDGTTVTDFDEEEIIRKHTLSSSLAHLEWEKNKVNIIDTPGFANFLSGCALGSPRRRGSSRRLSGCCCRR